MLRPVLGFLTFVAVLVMLAFNPVTAANQAGKENTHHGTIVKVDLKNHKVKVIVEGHPKPKHYKLVESVKLVDAQGHFIKINIFKKGDQVKIVEHEGQLKELHHKTHKSKPK